MTSYRAECVAEVLWELRQVEKVATFSEVAGRAGFRPGVEGKTMASCLEAVQKEWPHLQWWRAVPDDCAVKKDSPHARCLSEAGYELVPSRGRKTWVTFANLADSLFSWNDFPVEAPA